MMKAKLLILFICSLFILSGNSNLSAQVTIGSGIPPERGALLDHKETDTTGPTSDVTSLENAKKGVLYPKVLLRDAAKLTPLYGGVDTGGGVWSDNATAEEKLKATGMVVYNVNPKAINMDEGLYMWHMDEWVKLNQDGAAVIGPVDCSAIRINGSYIEGTLVTGNEYLEIDLEVTKKGSFVIAALSGNGYSFYYTGVALEIGSIRVKVPAQGTPALVRTDELKFSGISLVPGCVPEITVQKAIAEYTMVCSSAVLQGQYYKGRTLNLSSSPYGPHTITMNINISKPGSYDIYTETKNGIYFKGSGTFAGTGLQTVILYGHGTPTINEDFRIQIKANTLLGSAECSLVIPIILPAMTYAVIGQAGTDSWYSWSSTRRSTALTNGLNFGLTGIIKMESPLSRLWETDNAATAVTNLDNGVGGRQPDIVLYTGFSGPSSTALGQALARYVNKGGCIVYYTDDGNVNNTNTTINGIFGSTYSVSAIGTGSPNNYEDQLYQVNNNPNDPIIDGPFGNAAGYYWGEDNVHQQTLILSQLPPNSVQVCSASNPNHKDWSYMSSSVVWYSKDKNFVYFGDTTGAERVSSGNGTDNGWPNLYTTAGKPVPKRYGFQDSSRWQLCYNSILEMNAIAYFIRQAAVSGINPY
ncbi:hypothetical protein [Dysgonomonas reticulitermitis]